MTFESSHKNKEWCRLLWTHLPRPYSMTTLKIEPTKNLWKNPIWTFSLRTLSLFYSSYSYASALKALVIQCKTILVCFWKSFRHHWLGARIKTKKKRARANHLDGNYIQNCTRKWNFQALVYEHLIFTMGACFRARWILSAVKKSIILQEISFTWP